MVQNNSPQALVPYVEDAINEGIPVMTVNNRLDTELTSVIDCEPVDQGHVVAEYGIDLIPKNAKVIVLLGPSGNVPRSCLHPSGFHRTGLPQSAPPRPCALRHRGRASPS